MVKKNYNDWSKEDLIKEVEALKKQKTYGLLWEKDKTKEVFDYYINWDGVKTEEKFPEAEHKLPVLKEVKDKDITTDKDKDYNLLIEGDNYHALAVLNFTHNKSVDVCYIDPPYNTGNGEFIYNDKIVDNEDSYRHSKWLSFMEKRLKLAKNLLKEDGLIFISIDDNEMAQLRILCDEIFGEKNFVNSIIVKPANPVGLKMKNADKRIIRTKEYLLIYAKNYTKITFNPVYTEYEDFEHFNLYLDKNNSNNPKDWKVLKVKEVLAKKTKREEKDISKSEIKSFSIENLDKIYCSSFIEDRRDRKQFAEKNPNQVMIYKNPDGSEMYMYKKRALFPLKSKVKEVEGKLVPASVLCDLWLDVKWDGIANEGGVTFQNGKKPVKLIKRILELTDKIDEPVILDFFAGSGTTGQAVLEKNFEDKKNRKFILCTNDEGGICSKICYPRMSNVVKGYDNKKGFGGNLKYFRTDFVDSAPTDKNKKKIVDKSTEMICIKENAFTPVKETKEWKIFKNHNYYLGIIFDEDSIEDFVKEAKKLDKKIHVYVFSLDESVPEKEFKELKNKAKLCPIPEVILHVYRRIFK